MPVTVFLLGKRRCKREATKCRYVKSATLRHRRATVQGIRRKIRAELEAESNTTPWRVLVISRKQGRTFLSINSTKSIIVLNYLRFVRSARSIPGLLIYPRFSQYVVMNVTDIRSHTFQW